jgi:hypothetical protein
MNGHSSPDTKSNNMPGSDCTGIMEHQTILDVIRDHPENLEGRRQLCDRLFFRGSDSAEPVPLRCIWSPNAQKNLGSFFSVIRLLADRRVRSVLRLAFQASDAYFDEEIAA